jgi:PTH1 family peptidyl-tRNA hydrolase
VSFVRSLARLRSNRPEGRADWLIVGLGNPGAQYSKTRHNIGFMCLNRLATRSHTQFHSSKADRADIASAMVADVNTLMAQPQTYMNDSGVAVARMVKRLNLHPDHLILIYDDVDLPFGAIRIRQEGSAGGHRGVLSVVEHLQTTAVPRIRVGIGRGAAGTRDYVLTEFKPEERQQLSDICTRVSDAVEVAVTDGVIAAMNRFNSQPTVVSQAESAT